MTHDFICPLCGEAFTRDEKTLRCTRGHSFDLAKQGYVNLLPGGRLPGHEHGDNREMIRARRDFLSSGYYRPLSDAVNAVFAELVPQGGCVLDCGCGEGYYSASLAAFLAPKCVDVLATDISKDAVSYAARRGGIRCAVANSFRLPLPDGAFYGILSLCTPVAKAEFARVLRPAGYLVAVFPAPRHLWALKSAVYDAPYENAPALDISPYFEIVRQDTVRFSLHMEDAAAIRSLFSMTPYAYHTGQAERERLEALEELDDEASFVLSLCRRTQQA